MHPYAEPPTALPADRPVVSDVTDGPDGRHFTITFLPGQQLPTHRNASRVLITAVRGSGTMGVADSPPTPFTAGDRVQVDPNVPHALAAGDEGLEVLVHLIAGCCGVC